MLVTRHSSSSSMELCCIPNRPNLSRSSYAFRVSIPGKCASLHSVVAGRGATITVVIVEGRPRSRRTGRHSRQGSHSSYSHPKFRSFHHGVATSHAVNPCKRPHFFPGEFAARRG